jgi:hypothetical protein
MAILAIQHVPDALIGERIVPDQPRRQLRPDDRCRLRKIGPKMPLGPSSVVISTYAPEMVRGPADPAGRATGR